MRDIAQIVDEQLILRHCVFAPASVQLQFEQALSKARALSLHGRACRQYAFGDDDGHATAWGAMTKIKPAAREHQAVRETPRGFRQPFDAWRDLT
jgi:hypothetical protein